MEIDLNCDLGEGSAFDTELMPLITSANIACGFHAGDPATSYEALAAAARYGVQIGAHPGFPDREHFGRQNMQRSEPQILQDCLYQGGALMGLARPLAVEVRYLKPHGALYNMACRDAAYARPIVEAAAVLGLTIMGLPGSQLERCSAWRCPFVAEGFADRRYLPDGSLVPRSNQDAFVDDAAEAVRQVKWLIQAKAVRSVCVHGDNPKAVAFVRALRAALPLEGITLRSFA
jgi:UPF0271 protein